MEGPAEKLKTLFITFIPFLRRENDTGIRTSATDAGTTATAVGLIKIKSHLLYLSYAKKSRGWEKMV